MTRIERNIAVGSHWMFREVQKRRKQMFKRDTDATICSILIHKLEKRREILGMMAEIPAEYVM